MCSKRISHAKVVCTSVASARRFPCKQQCTPTAGRREVDVNIPKTNCSGQMEPTHDRSEDKRARCGGIPSAGRFHTMLQAHDVDIVLVSEWRKSNHTYLFRINNKWTSSSTNDPTQTTPLPYTLPNIPNYTFFAQTTDVGIYVRDTLNPTHKPLTQLYSPNVPFNSYLHATAVDITVNNSTHAFLAFYCSPSNSYHTKPTQLYQYTSQLINPTVICGGDLNIHHTQLGDLTD